MWLWPCGADRRGRNRGRMCKKKQKEIIHKSSDLKTGQKGEMDGNLTCLSTCKGYKVGKAEEGMGQNELKWIFEEPPTEWAQNNPKKWNYSGQTLTRQRRGGRSQMYQKSEMIRCKAIYFGNSIIGVIESTSTFAFCILFYLGFPCYPIYNCNFSTIFLFTFDCRGLLFCSPHLQFHNFRFFEAFLK